MNPLLRGLLGSALLVALAPSASAAITLTLNLGDNTLTASQPDGVASGFQRDSVGQSQFRYEVGSAGDVFDFGSLLIIKWGADDAVGPVTNISNAGGFFFRSSTFPTNAVVSVGLSATPSAALPVGFVTPQLVDFFRANPQVDSFFSSEPGDAAPPVELRVVPEPASALLVGLGLLGFARRRRR